jgi:hypothetical protein
MSTDGQLNTFDLQALMSDDPDFVGVFSLDTLPRNREHDRHLPLKLIVNLEPKRLPGSHWVAISRRLGGEAYYFDTFGQPPPKEIATWLNKNALRYKFFKQPIQETGDLVSCGYLCVKYLQQVK